MRLRLGDGIALGALLGLCAGRPFVALGTFDTFSAFRPIAAFRVVAAAAANMVAQAFGFRGFPARLVAAVAVTVGSVAFAAAVLAVMRTGFGPVGRALGVRGLSGRGRGRGLVAGEPADQPLEQAAQAGSLGRGRGSRCSGGWRR
jgi:hypothetical protein